MNVSFSNRMLHIDDREIELEHQILDAFPARDLVIVLFNPDSHRTAFGQFRNLIAVNARGEREWVADLPTANSADAYYAVASHDPLVAYSNQSFDVEIDASTGRIVRETFTK